MKTRTTFAAALLLVLAAVPALCEDRLLIMAPNEFLDALQPLRRFKEASLRRTWLLGLDQVYQNFPAGDKSESVKKCIQAHHENDAVTHVMMVGDAAQFPVRYRWWGRAMPNDPYFRGQWYVTRGEYHQSEEAQSKPYCSWVDVGASTYTINVDCKAISGAAAREVRIYYADAQRNGSKYHVQFRSNAILLMACESQVWQAFTFALDTSYNVNIDVRADRVVLSVNGSQLIDQPFSAGQPANPGKIGLGTFLCHASFDDFLVTRGETTLKWEDFQDGVANGFSDTNDMDERGWAVSDLYFANLYRPIPDWPFQGFDTWDGNGNGLHGEIEWNPDPNNCGSTCKRLNNDQIGYVPNVAVGRVPAATVEQVRCYVNKVLLYEMGARADAAWFKRASLYEGSTGDEGVNNTIETFLEQPGLGFTVSNRRWSELEGLDRRSIAVSDFNNGAGMINYVGHGNVNEWSCMDFHDTQIRALTNGAQRWQMPVVFASACFTGKFAPLPVLDSWTDKNGQVRGGAPTCEPLPPNPADAAPNCLQTGRAVSCLGNEFLFNGGGLLGAGGAIVYLGERSAGRFWCDRIAEAFFESYSPGTTVGSMWMSAIQSYYDANNLSQSGTWIFDESKWEDGHMFDEPQKLTVFGDPSLLVGGAFNNYRSGVMWDTWYWQNGPFLGGIRYRIVDSVGVTPGNVLTALAGTSLFFEPGKSIVGWAAPGFFASGTQSSPVWFMSLGPEPQRDRVIHGAKISGQMWLLNGGTIKLY